MKKQLRRCEAGLMFATSNVIVTSHAPVDRQ